MSHDQSPIGDRATAHDTLNYDRYADALVSFIVYEETETPIAMTIDGQWGAGKTSLMQMMRQRLNVLDVPTVEFNAWLYSGEEQVWAAIATAVIQQSFRARRGFWASLWLGINLFMWRYLAERRATATPQDDVSAAFVFSGLNLVRNFWRHFVVLGLILVALMAVIPALNSNFDGNVQLITGAVATLGTLLSAIRQTTNLHLGRYIGRFWRFDDYQERLGYLHEFRRDFDAIVHAISYTNQFAGPNKTPVMQRRWRGKNAAAPVHKLDGESRVVIFVDDLDRCLPNQVASTIEAISVFLDTPNCVFVIGMETSIVAASLNVRYADIGDQIGLDASGTSIGFNFLEKIIQVSFRLPRPDISADSNFLQHLLSPAEYTPTPLDKPFQLNLDMTPEMRHAINMVVHKLQNNPRRVKRFINLYRLNVAILQHEDSPVRLVTGQTDDYSVTYEELADWVLLGMLYPDFVANMRANDKFDDRFVTLYEEYDGLKDGHLQKIMREQSLNDDVIARYIANEQLYEIVKRYCKLEETDSKARYNLYINQALSATTTAGTEKPLPRVRFDTPEQAFKAMGNAILDMAEERERGESGER